MIAPTLWSAANIPAPAPAPAPAQPAVKDTPWQKAKNSPVGRFVRENKLVTTGAGIGGTIVIAGGAAQSQAFANVARYGIVPAAGAGLAALSAAAMHDAVVNDLGQHNGRAALKLAGGTVGFLGGTQMVGAAYEIPILDEALTGTIEKVGEYGQALLGVGVLGGAAAAAKFAANRANAAKNSEEHRGANIALAVTATGASAAGVLGGAELIGRQFSIPGMDRAFTNTVEFLSQGGLGSAAGGALLVGGGAVLAQEAVHNFRKGGNDLLTVVEGMGAATATLGGLELVGHGLKIEALEGLLTSHADTVGSVALTAAGAAVARMSFQNLQAKGLTAKNSVGMTAGSVAAIGGVGLAAETFGLSKAAEMAGRGAGTVAGIGLGVTTFALGRNAVSSFKKGEILHGAAYATAGSVTATGSLFALGESLEIEALTRLSRGVAEHTVVPLFDHVIEPVGTFLFENPIAGAVILAAGVGAYIWYKHKH